MNQTDILTVRNLNVSYGESKVLFDIEMGVRPGQVVACVMPVGRKHVSVRSAPIWTLGSDATA